MRLRSDNLLYVYGVEQGKNVCISYIIFYGLSIVIMMRR